MTETIEGYTLTQTCRACPEQYDVHFDGVQVGYLRLRHSYFSAEYPCSGGETVYEAEPEGDGCFEADERDGYLRAAILAIKARHTRMMTAPEPEAEAPTLLGVAEMLKRARLEALEECRDLAVEEHDSYLADMRKYLDDLKDDPEKADALHDLSNMKLAARVIANRIEMLLRALKTGDPA